MYKNYYMTQHTLPMETSVLSYIKRLRLWREYKTYK